MTKDSTTNGPFLTFLFFQRKEILKDFFCNIFFKMLKIPPINHITCVNFKKKINMNFLKWNFFARFYILLRKIIIISNHVKI
jgi:hypothetical protein